MANPNIANITAAYGNTVVTTASTSNYTLHTVVSGDLVKIKTCSFANKTSTAANVDLMFTRGGTNYYLANNVVVPAQASFIAISKDNEVYLLEADSLKCRATTNSAIDVIASFESVNNS